MTMRNLLYLLALVAFSSAGQRNPFLPLVAPCDVLLSQLDRWRLRGIVLSPQGAVALMNDDEKRWRRVTLGTALVPGAVVVNISLNQAQVSLAEPCPGANYHWEIQGKLYGMETLTGAAGAVAAGESGR